jgi:RNA polymerase sigma factor (sigma-70 family)
VTPPGESAGRDTFNEVLRCKCYIRCTLVRRGVPGVFVDDLVQDVLLVAWRVIEEGGFRLSEGRSLAESVRSWLGVIAANVARNLFGSPWYRQWMNDAVDKDAVDEDGEFASPEPDPEAWHAYVDVIHAMDRLKPEHRDVVALTAEGMSVVEAGHALGISENTVTSRIQRARSALRVTMQRWRRV